uniref:Putative secreted protein n=1 Tax=Ixodes ricinus TaxID=34613 RepID=A0A6B0UC80_IXORI
MGTVHGHLIICLVPVLHAKVIGVKLDIQEGQDELLFDEIPDYSGHFVPKDVHYRSTLDLGHGENRVKSGGSNIENVLGSTKRSCGRLLDCSTR